jgi:hypothetical protein
MIGLQHRAPVSNRVLLVQKKAGRRFLPHAAESFTAASFAFKACGINLK